MHKLRQFKSAKTLVCMLGMGMLAGCASTSRESAIVPDAPEAALVFPGVLHRELALARGAPPGHPWEHARNDRSQGDVGPAYGPIESAAIDYYDRQRSIDGRVRNDLLIRTRIRRFYPPSR